MKDAHGLEVTANNADAVVAINTLTELLFRKKSGVDDLLPAQANAHPECPMLQIYAAIMYFSFFSSVTITEHFPTYLLRLEHATLNEREALHFSALQKLHTTDLSAALNIYIKIAEKYPEDKVNILMIETCGFLGGKIDVLPAPYARLLEHHSQDPDFLGMYAFLLCHQHQLTAARGHIETALTLDPHNAWVQHVYAHTLDEADSAEVELGIKFLQLRIADWPKQNRFFEGHNWMHLCGLYFLCDNFSFNQILSEYRAHIWGEAKAFSFEQNNAFWVLWQAILHGHKSEIPPELKEDLAIHAQPFMYDYVTPFLTICAILSVAQFSIDLAAPGLAAFEKHIASMSSSPKKDAWQNVALPVLQGCIEFLKGNYEAAQTLLAVPANDLLSTRPICHSDEQRAIFPETLKYINKLLTQQKETRPAEARPLRC